MSQEKLQKNDIFVESVYLWKFKYKKNPFQ